MKKKIRNMLRIMGCIVLSASVLLTACKPQETTKKKKKKKPTTTETTEETETTDEPSESTDPTDPTDPTAPANIKYTGAEAAQRLHELDTEIFREGKEDIISMVFDLEDPTQYDLEWPEDGIKPWSHDNDDASHEFDVYVMDSLKEIDFDSLSLEDQLLYETLMRDYQLSLDMNGMDYYISSMNSLTGENVELPIVFATLGFDDQGDVERYLKMLEDVKPYMESVFVYEKERAEKGWSRPDDILDDLIGSLKAVYENHEGNYMYTTFEDRINEMNLDDATKKDLIAKNKEILDNSFFPAYEDMAKNMETLRGTAQTTGKICEMEGGKEFYEKYFQLRSGTNLTIAEAKEYLEDEIYKIYQDFYMKYLQLTPEQQEEFMSEENNYTTGSFESDIEFCKEEIKADFPDIGDVKYFVYHLPKEMSENFSPAAYMSTPIDDINKNVLMINDNSDGLGDMLPTVAHEAFPGHLFEAVYHMQHMNNFYQKGGTTAYKEGWSTYSEDYIMKFTDYDLDVYEARNAYLGLLNYQLQAYLDICVHYDGWGRQEVVNYSNTLFPGGGEEIADFFYDRILEIPCYVTPYCFGNMNCKKIINDAVAQYGNSYSMKEIHAAYLDMGPSSFDILEKYMPLYVEKQH